MVPNDRLILLVMILNNVVLPDPLCPKNPNIYPYLI